jgi:hypothetical protein
MIYLLFISYCSGGHYNTVHTGIEQVIAALNELADSDGVDYKPPDESWLEERFQLYDDFWAELPNSTWFTITPLDEYGLKQLEKYFHPNEIKQNNLSLNNHIEETIASQNLPVNTKSMLNRMSELMEEKSTNSLQGIQDRRIRKLLWLLNSQVFGQLAIINMEQEWKELTNGSDH